PDTAGMAQSSPAAPAIRTRRVVDPSFFPSFFIDPLPLEAPEPIPSWEGGRTGRSSPARPPSRQRNRFVRLRPMVRGGAPWVTVSPPVFPLLDLVVIASALKMLFT